MRKSSSIAALLIDVDYFKLYNDRYGHAAGDKCLHKVAHAIKLPLKRPADLAARYGGEEFVVILPETEASQALQIAERIRLRVAAMGLEHAGSGFGAVTISIGVAVAIPHADVKESALLLAADRALYAAKGAGRNRAMLDDPEAECQLRSA